MKNFIQGLCSSLTNQELQEIKSPKAQRSFAFAKGTGDGAVFQVIGYKELAVFGNEFGEYEDIKELRKKAIHYCKTHLQGANVWNHALANLDADGSGKVEFTSEGRDKVKSNSAQEDTLLPIKYLPILIADAEHIGRKEAMSERHKKLGDSFYYLYTKHEMRGDYRNDNVRGIS